MSVVMEAPTRSLSCRVQIVDPTLDPRWDVFIESRADASPFHHSSWARVLIDSYGYEPRYHVLEGETGIEAAWPSMLVRSRLSGTRLVTLPFSDYCPPLLACDAQADALYQSMLADRDRTGASRIEVRGWPDSICPHNGLMRTEGYIRHARS